MQVEIASGYRVNVKSEKDLKVTQIYKDGEKIYALHKSFESGFALLGHFKTSDEAETIKAYIEAAINSGEKVYRIKAGEGNAV